MTKKLLLSDGTRERELHLVGRIVVGRDPSCEISHDDSLLSRRHAEFVTAGNIVTVKDLGSRNGVFVNGTRASEHTLEPGDVVQIGPLRARFVADATPRSISPEAMDVDRTAVIRHVSPPPVAPPPAIHPAVALAFKEIDEDATRLVPARTEESASESAPLFRRPDEPAANEADKADKADEEDEDITRFTAAPEMPPPRPVLRRVEPPVRIAPVEPPVMPVRVAALAPTVNPLGVFVYGQLAVLAMVVLGATGAAIVMWRRSLVADGGEASSSLGWLALPVVAAIAATVVIGGAMNRRITSALAAGDRTRT